MPVKNKIPFLGLCWECKLMVVEFARLVLNDDQINSSEFDRSTPHPVMILMPINAELWIWEAPCVWDCIPCALTTRELKPPNRMHVYVEKNVVQERHRHRFEFNNNYRELLEKEVCSIPGYLQMAGWSKLQS
jgi:CTP synthase